VGFNSAFKGLNYVTSVYKKSMVAGVKKHLSHEGTSSASHG
jgi:hypothetical protein